MSTPKDLIAQAQSLLTQASALLPDAAPTTSFYTAVTDRVIRPRPAPLVLGPAGFRFNDKAYNTPMLRLTDEKTGVGGPSWKLPSNANASAVSCDGKKFLVLNSGGDCKVYAFDAATFTPTLTDLVAGSGNVEPTFSYVDPDLIWGSKGHVVGTWKHSVWTPVFDLRAAYPTLLFQSDDEPARDYVGGVILADGDTWLAFWGGGTQDHHIYAHHSKAGLFDLTALGMKIHAAGMDRTGRRVFVTPTQADIDAKRAASQILMWDTEGPKVLTPIMRLPTGHGTVGYNDIMINQACCSGSAFPWDAMQWQKRSVLTPDQTTDLILVPPSVKSQYVADHANWRHARPNVLLPVVTVTYRNGEGLNETLWPWAAGNDEILAIATDGSGTWWRFAHHQSDLAGDWDGQPIVNVSPDGKWCLLKSNWRKTLGTFQGSPRQDVFIVALP